MGHASPAPEGLIVLRRVGRDPEEPSSEGPCVIFLDHGTGSRNNLVSSLRKDCCREVHACTTPCGAPGDPAHHSRSLDVESVPYRGADNRRLRTSFRAASRRDRAAHCRYLTARPFCCARFPGKHRHVSQMDAFVDYAGRCGPRASFTGFPGRDLQAEASATKCGWRTSVPSERRHIRIVHELFRPSGTGRGLQCRDSHTMTRSHGDARFRPIASTPNRKAACGAPPVGAPCYRHSTRARPAQSGLRSSRRMFRCRRGRPISTTHASAKPERPKNATMILPVAT
jgi:hypothetical protein